MHELHLQADSTLLSKLAALLPVLLCTQQLSMARVGQIRACDHDRAGPLKQPLARLVMTGTCRSPASQEHLQLVHVDAVVGS